VNGPRRPDLERLKAPVPWRPALQIGDAGYPVPKPVLRDMIRRAQGTRRR
jgi:hypothetical protein